MNAVLVEYDPPPGPAPRLAFRARWADDVDPELGRYGYGPTAAAAEADLRETHPREEETP
jgi:hypothetical protein